MGTGEADVHGDYRVNVNLELGFENGLPWAGALGEEALLLLWITGAPLFCTPPDLFGAEGQVERGVVSEYDILQGVGYAAAELVAFD